MPTSEQRSKAFTYPWWIMNYFILTERFLKILTLKYNTSVSFSPLYRQLETQVISGQLQWKLTSPKSMTHVSNPWSLTHSAALVLLRIRAEGLLWPSRSIVTPRCHHECEKTKCRTARGSEPWGSMLLMSLLCFRKHQTLRAVKFHPETSHLAALNHQSER